MHFHFPFSLSLFLFSFFLLFLYFHLLLGRFRMFTKLHGRKHSIFGGCYLLLLCIYLVDVLTTLDNDAGRREIQNAILDICLNSVGVLLTASAASDFGHKNVKNSASGTLDQHATVTFDEMQEHKFYQILNLFQIFFLHVVCYISRFAIDKRDEHTSKFLAYLFATAPWLFRHFYPVHPSISLPNCYQRYHSRVRLHTYALTRHISHRFYQQHTGSLSY